MGRITETKHRVHSFLALELLVAEACFQPLAVWPRCWKEVKDSVFTCFT